MKKGSDTELAATATLTDDDRLVLAAVRDHFAAVMGAHVHVEGQFPALFTTDVGDTLWPTFLLALPEPIRQTYTCHACHRFVQVYGGLALIDGGGTIRSPFWAGEPPAVFAEGFRQMAAVIEDANVTGVFITQEQMWGTPETGPWNHFAVAAHGIIRVPASKTPAEVAGERQTDYETLTLGLEEFDAALVRNAYSLLTTGQLFRSEKCIAVARWLTDLHFNLATIRDQRRRQNVIWRAVGSAPPGFCHIRSTMIGTLLEDLAAGRPFPDVKRRFDSKMSPLQYQRPTAPPAPQQIEKAEQVVADLAAAGALRRRYARIEDVRCIWRPRPTVEAAELGTGGVFDGVRSDAAAARRREPDGLEAPPTRMTWAKFSAQVLPAAESVEFFVDRRTRSFIALTTAVNPEATPILQWDREGDRYPVGWYVYTKGGAPPEAWNLDPDRWYPVTGFALLPPMVANLDHHGMGVIAILQGCRDNIYQSGALFFPEQLRSEFHGVRATLEAFSKRGELLERDEATACGVDMRGGRDWTFLVRVTSPTGRIAYRLDRWD